jgi:hypothetical protein
MQFVVLIGLTLGYTFSAYIYTLFIGMGIFAFLELIQAMAIPKRS